MFVCTYVDGCYPRAPTAHVTIFWTTLLPSSLTHVPHLTCNCSTEPVQPLNTHRAPTIKTNLIEHPCPCNPPGIAASGVVLWWCGGDSRVLVCWCADVLVWW